jgi:uncharacterized membrane protein YhaH (DUF805 family)
MSLLSDHFRGLLSFTGRERRQPFWLWILIVYVGQFIVSTVAMIPIMSGFSDSFAPLTERAQSDPTYLDQHPEAFQQVFAQMLPMMQTVMAMTATLALVLTALIAAAVVRRLHDTDRSGWWAAPNFAIQIAMPVLYASILPRFFATFANFRPDMPPDQINAAMGPAFSSMMALSGLGMIGFVMLIVLIVLLCQPTSLGSNRFGAEPNIT